MRGASLPKTRCSRVFLRAIRLQLLVWSSGVQGTAVVVLGTRPGEEFVMRKDMLIPSSRPAKDMRLEDKCGERQLVQKAISLAVFVLCCFAISKTPSNKTPFDLPYVRGDHDVQESLQHLDET